MKVFKLAGLFFSIVFSLPAFAGALPGPGENPYTHPSYFEFLRQQADPNSPMNRAIAARKKKLESYYNLLKNNAISLSEGRSKYNLTDPDTEFVKDTIVEFAKEISEIKKGIFNAEDPGNLEDSLKKPILALHEAILALIRMEKKWGMKPSFHLLISDQDLLKIANNHQYKMRWSGLEFTPRKEKYSIGERVDRQISAIKHLGVNVGIPISNDVTLKDIPGITAALLKHGMDPTGLVNSVKSQIASQEAAKRAALNFAKSCELKKVVRTFKRNTDTLLAITHSGGKTVEATLEHPFFSLSKKRYVRAIDLDWGEELLHENGEAVIITKLKLKFGSFPVYNLEVEKNNNYFAGGVLAHNCNLVQAARAEAVAAAGKVADAIVPNAEAALPLAVAAPTAVKALVDAAVVTGVVGSAVVGGHALHEAIKENGDDGDSEKQEATSGQTLIEQKSTGRTAPNDLKEKLAMEEAMASPAGEHLENIKMKDPRYPASDGWIKMEQKVGSNPTDTVVIHYLKNTKTGAAADFKFK